MWTLCSAYAAPGYIVTVEKLGIDWPQIVGAGKLPMHLYGFNAIPCIIMFAPDGTIAFRDKYGDVLRQAVDSLMTAQLSEDGGKESED